MSFADTRRHACLGTLHYISASQDSSCEPWQRRCGECAKGDIDQDLNGNGRYQVEWYAVPCNVGNSKLTYVTVSKSHWIFAFVIGNHRCPATPPACILPERMQACGLTALVAV